MCDWLLTSVEASQIADYSYLWRPAVEEHDQNPDHDAAGVMVGFVREGFEQAIRSGSLSLQSAVKIIGRYSHIIYERLRLHLIREFADQDAELARQTILNRRLFDNHHYKHEYAMLVGRRLGLLSSQERDEWFGWIDAGPDMSDFDQSMKNLGRDEPTEEDRENWVREWRFMKLHWVRTHLEGARQEFHNEMLAKHGEPETAHLHVRTSLSWTGDESPVTVEQLAAMTFEEALDAVSSWRPEKSRFMGPSITGLGSTFEQFIATNPEEFSKKAGKLVGRPAVFVRGFINKMAEALNAGVLVDVPSVLDLCGWVVQRPIQERTTFHQEDECLADVNWQWTRDEISRFVENVCKAENGNTPRYPLDGLRERMWQLLAVLCRDSAESNIIHDAAQDDRRVHDYLGIAINSPRGKAVQAALEYARWIAKNRSQFDDKQELVPAGFHAMPEVREMLDWQMALENRSSEALSVIGSRMGLIYWMDRQWLAQNADRLFNLKEIEGEPAGAHGWAAWNAFLVWVMPHIEFYRTFKSQFVYAVQQSESVKLPERTDHQPMYHLGEHLLLVYARGQLGLDDDECLLRRFLENAIPEIRRHSISFVGQCLEREGNIPKEVIERCETLWDLYWAGPGKKDAEESPNSWLFGFWFSCGKFPEGWALDRLQKFVEVNPTVEPDHTIAQRLAEMAHVNTEKAVLILDEMVRGDREGWRITGWLDSAKAILGAALNSPGKAREVAERLVDYLGRRGYSEFGQLL